MKPILVNEIVDFFFGRSLQRFWRVGESVDLTHLKDGEGTPLWEKAVKGVPSREFGYLIGVPVQRVKGSGVSLIYLEGNRVVWEKVLLGAKRPTLIMGSCGVGKTRLAIQKAKAYGEMELINWKHLKTPFGLGNAMKSLPGAVVVEDVPPDELHKAFIFDLVRNDEIVTPLKGKDPVKVKRPYLIFTTNGEVNLTGELRKLFEIIVL